MRRQVKTGNGDFGVLNGVDLRRTGRKLWITSEGIGPRLWMIFNAPVPRLALRAQSFTYRLSFLIRIFNSSLASSRSVVS
jgi:hypothetical protein